MNILLPTVYPIVSGSTRVLQAAAHALSGEHRTVVRAPLLDADERLSWSFPPDNIETFAEKASVLPRVVARAVGEARYLLKRHFDVIYVHDEPSLYVYGLAARMTGIPLMRHVHMRAEGLLERIRSNLATDVIHISQHAKGASGGTVIRNPLRSLQINRKPSSGELVVAGSISSRKNQILAIEVLAELLKRSVDWRLRLCGDVIEPGYAGAARQRAQELGVITHVVFEGPVPTENYLSTASCVLMTSHYENQPLALLEAVAARVPVVASEIAAHRELVSLGCLDAQALRPLRAADFVEGVLSVQTPSQTEADRVRDTFSEERFRRELLAYFERFRARVGARAA